jgi:ferredoxin
VPENVPGDFFVDSTCIDCDACRQIAPAVFGEAAETSFVKAQPGSSTRAIASKRHEDYSRRLLTSSSALRKIPPELETRPRR